MRENLSYETRDISVIIPTYNRFQDLAVTLKALEPFFKILGEIIIVDQSTDSKTKEVVDSYKSKVLKYVRSETPSIPIARNVGVANTRTQSTLFCFIDDDVTVAPDYFDRIVATFNNFPDAKGVAGYVPTPLGGTRAKIDNLLKRIIRVHHLTRGRAEIFSAYGNSYPCSLEAPLRSHWLPGVNMVYKREVFAFQQFDNNLLGYTIAEDIDFSYRLYKKFPGSLIITPEAQLVHRASTVERLPTRKMSYVNQVDHFYFHYKNISGRFLSEFVFAWSLFGIGFLRILNVVSFPKKSNILKALFYFDSVWYCIRNVSLIRRGNVRAFKV